MSETVRSHSGDLDWVHFIPICNPAFLGPVTSKAENLINSDSLLKLIFTPLASLSYICIFVVLLVYLCINCIFLFFGIPDALASGILPTEESVPPSQLANS